MSPVEDTTATITAALEQVAPRLRKLRQQRGTTLTALSAETGISTSTLSRLETGQRRPSLELLLPLSQAYRVPLDDLVGAPDVADPRVRLKPRQVKGRTVIPLSEHPGAAQAWKIVVPVSNTRPEPRTHEGHEWLHVLSGRLRLVLDDVDVVLEQGEVVDFDTAVPHWFGSTGREPAEVLSLYGRPGEHLRSRTAVQRPVG